MSAGVHFNGCTRPKSRSAGPVAAPPPATADCHLAWRAIYSAGSPVRTFSRPDLAVFATRNTAVTASALTMGAKRVGPPCRLLEQTPWVPFGPATAQRAAQL